MPHPIPGDRRNDPQSNWPRDSVRRISARRVLLAVLLGSLDIVRGALENRARPGLSLSAELARWCGLRLFGYGTGGGGALAFGALAPRVGLDNSLHEVVPHD